MELIYIIIFLLAIWLSVICRLIVLHPLATVLYAFKDTFFYFKHHKYDYYDAGKLLSFQGHFGKGKTLSVVHMTVEMIYKRYNNKEVYDREQKRMVTQKVHIISNVTLHTVPYEELCSISQVV